MSDWTTTNLKKKSKKAADYIDYAKVPVGDDTYELAYELADQDQMLDVQEKIDIASVAEAESNIQNSDELAAAEETVAELQTKEGELTDAEEERLQDAQITLAKNRGKIVDALGRESLDALYNLGRNNIVPDDEDISNALENPHEAVERFKGIEDAPTPSNGEWTRSMIREALKAEMVSILDDVPFMIYFTLGQTVFEESQSAGKLVES